MEETDFDRLFLTPELYTLKMILPFLPPEAQKWIAFIIKWQELSQILSLLSHKNKQLTAEHTVTPITFPFSNSTPNLEQLLPFLTSLVGEDAELLMQLFATDTNKN